MTMPRFCLLFLLGLLLVNYTEAQKSKSKSKKFTALLPVFEPPKPKTNSIVEKSTKKDPAASLSPSIEAVATIELGKEKASQQNNHAEIVLPPKPLKPVQEPKTIIQSPPSIPNQIPKKNVKASPYSLFPEGQLQKKQSNTPVQQYQPPTQTFSRKNSIQSFKNAPSKPRPGNVNFFGFKPMTSSTPAPTTPAPPPPVQQSLFNFFSGQNGPSPTQQALPFPLPSMPPYPGLPNNNPQLKNVYRMIATWLVSHAMNANNNNAPRAPQPVTTTKRTHPPAPMRLPNTQRQQQKQQRRHNLTPPPQRNRKQMKAPKHSQKKQQTQRNKKQEEALRRMREKAYREYMDEVFDVDVPDTAFANGRIPSFQAPSFEFPW